MKVGIIGLGVIGSAQAEMFAGHDLVTYDPAVDDTYPFEELAGCDFAIVCVGTPQATTGTPTSPTSSRPPQTCLPASLSSCGPRSLPAPPTGCSEAQIASIAMRRSSWARTSCTPGSGPQTSRT
jgi:hypothetical protein